MKSGSPSRACRSLHDLAAIGVSAGQIGPHVTFLPPHLLQRSFGSIIDMTRLLFSATSRMVKAMELIRPT